MKTKNNFIIFVSISFIAHVVFLIQATQQDIILPIDAGNIMSISITNNAVSTQVPPKTLQIKKSEQKPIINHKTITKKKYNKHIQTNSTTLIENKNRQETPKISTNESPSSIPKVKIISLLREKIQQNFYYPKLAQRRNWQGDVQLAFDVNNYGSIKNITVKESSGYEILDNAAMNALIKVHSIPDLDLKSNFYSDLKLTVKYRLKDI